MVFSPSYIVQSAGLTHQASWFSCTKDQNDPPNGKICEIIPVNTKSFDAGSLYPTCVCVRVCLCVCARAFVPQLHKLANSFADTVPDFYLILEVFSTNGFSKYLRFKQ